MPHFLKLLLLMFSIKVTICEYEPAYLKVCSEDFKFYVDSTKCHKGVWLKESFQPGCVCVRGVWALSNGFCDDQAVIIVGDGHCYNIPFEIRSAKLIGDAEDPFKPAIFVAPLSLDLFYEVIEGGFTPSFSTDSTLVIGVNPRHLVQRGDFALCVDLDEKDYDKPLHIFQSARRVATEWTLDTEKQYSCPSISRYHHHIKFGEMFSVEKSQIQPKLLVERHCKKQCPDEVLRNQIAGSSTGQRYIQGRFMRPLEVYPHPFPRKLMYEKVSSINPESLESRFEGFDRKTSEELFKEKEELRTTASVDMDNFERELNEQTLRMMRAHISPLILGVQGPRVMTREYQYFQHVREVVEKACPEEYVPKHVLKGLMRMFRQLLFETQDTLHHSQSRDDDLFNRTISRLSECAIQTPPPTIMFANWSDTWSLVHYETIPQPEHICLVPMVLLNDTDINGTISSSNEAFFKETFKFFFPPHMNYNVSEVDFIIESAWKVTLIGHYRCSAYFDDATAIDFSQFFHQLESLFNQRILKRWLYKKSAKATFDVTQMTFPSYDLHKFMLGLDSCLAGIQGISNYDYSTMWLQRPKVPQTENDVNLEQNPNSPNPLPQLNSTSAGRKLKWMAASRKASNARSNLQRRRKKRSIQLFYLWNDQATCITNYMGPILYPGRFHYTLPSDCAIPVDPFLNDTVRNLK